MLKYNIIDILVEKIFLTTDQKVIKYTSWALCGLVTGGQKLPKKRIAINALIKLIMTQEDLEVLAQSLTALLDLMDESIVQILIDSKLVARLFLIAKHRYKNILFPLLQIVSFVSNGTDSQTQCIIDCGGIDIIFSLLEDPGMDLYCRKECLWIISNIIVGTYDQMKFIFSRPNWVMILLSFTKHENIKVSISPSI